MAKEPQKVDVTLEDQQKINAFNNLNSKMHEIESQISVQKKLLEELEDAGNELMLSDEETVRYVLGECMVHLEKEDAEARLQDTSDTVQKQVASLNTELAAVKDEMTKLKAILYGKFGKSINLDE